MSLHPFCLDPLQEVLVPHGFLICFLVLCEYMLVHIILVTTLAQNSSTHSSQ